MIARLWLGRKVLATLLDDRTWNADSLAVVQALNMQAPATDYGPALGDSRCAQAMRGGDVMGARVEILIKPEEPEEGERVY